MSSSKYPLRHDAGALAWLQSGECRWAVRPIGWSAAPTPHGLAFFSSTFFLNDSPQPWLCGERVPWPSVSDFIPAPTLRSVRAAEAGPFFVEHREILAQLHQGSLRKLVPFVRDELVAREPWSWRHFAQAFADPGSLCAYGWQVGESGLCGVTPEVLFHVRSGVLQTMALAGTGTADGPSLLADRKERLEHEVVVDHLQNDLRALGAVTVGATREQAFAALKHLLTPITVALRARPDFVDLVTRLHPTAALGGWPRAEALRWLAQGDRRARGRFGAPFGVVDGDDMLCVVAIRGVQWEGERAWLSAGCGVVAGSVAEREWQELRLKQRATAARLGLVL